MTSVPYAAIKAFLSKPSVLSKRQARNLPYILSSLDNHLVSGSGNTVYARGFKSPPRIGEVFNVIHIGDEIRDPILEEPGSGAVLHCPVVPLPVQLVHVQQARFLEALRSPFTATWIFQLCVSCPVVGSRSRRAGCARSQTANLATSSFARRSLQDGRLSSYARSLTLRTR